MILLKKTIIGSQELDISIKKIWVLQQTNIWWIAKDSRRLMISQDTRKVYGKRKAKNSGEKEQFEIKDRYWVAKS